MGLTQEEYLKLLGNCNRVADEKKKKKKAKYRNVACYADGFRFDSIKERNYFLNLKLLQESGAIHHFLRQTPFHLSTKVTYRIDFIIFHNDENRTVEYVDVKGYMTKTSKAKISWTEQKYNIKINVVY